MGLTDTIKTIEVARLQVGEQWRHMVKIVVSTLAEAEHLFPFLLECQDHGKSVNVRSSPALFANPSISMSAQLFRSCMASRSLHLLCDDLQNSVNDYYRAV